jgi:hypothetical protein
VNDLLARARSNALRIALGGSLEGEVERSLFSMGGDAGRAGWRAARVICSDICINEINGY